MLEFRILAWVTLLGTAAALVFFRYRTSPAAGPFPSWLRGRLKRALRGFGIKSFQDWADRHVIRPHPPGRRWFFLGLLLTFAYLALSGFFFALIWPRPLHGIFLMAHVSLGGVYAVCLAGVVFVRARVYRMDRPTDDPGLGAAPGARAPISRLLFWAFVLSGLSLIVTALLMMLPLLAQADHLKAVSLHRFSALAAVLSGLAFAGINLESPGVPE